MIKVVNLARIATSFLLILVLGFVYANLPARVGLLFNKQVGADIVIDRDDFFYLAILGFLIANLIVFIFVKLLESIPVNSQSLFFSSSKFKENSVVWMGSLAPVINLFFVFIISFMGIYNNGDVVLINSYGYLAYLGQFLVVGWLFTAILILWNRKI